MQKNGKQLEIYLHEGELWSQEGGKHEDKQDSSSKLKVTLGFVVSHRGNTSKERFALLTTLSQDK